MPFPEPMQHTVAAIYAAYMAVAESWDQFGINVGELGGECDRSIYYSFRWASELEKHDGKKLRRFDTGNREEERLIADLERAGVQVFGQQERIRFVAGHVRGKIDGRAIGLPEAPKTEHLLECKATSQKLFTPLAKNGVLKQRPAHYVQCQLGMHALGSTRALYLVVNTNDETLWQERIEYDAEYCLKMLARAERIITATRPPARVAEKHDKYPCIICRHQAVCHFDAFARVTCRSCIHSTPEMSGDAHWSCARWQKPLTFDEQKAACPTHLYDPDLVPGEQIDADETAETITYRMKNGTVWTDGQQVEQAA